MLLLHPHYLHNGDLRHVRGLARSTDVAEHGSVQPAGRPTGQEHAGGQAPRGRGALLSGKEHCSL